MKFTPILLAILSGLLLWLGWPTYGFAGLLFVGFVPLLLAEYKIRKAGLKAKGWRVLGFCYVSFFIWNFATTSWLYYATGFGMWFAVLVNSLLMALVFLCYHHFARKATQSASLLFLVCLWMAFEYLHLHWDFSWPWLNLGNGFSEYTSWIQWYEYTGTFGGTLWIWIVNFLVFKSVLWVLRFRESETTTGINLKIIARRSILPILVITVPIAISVILGSLRTTINKGGGTQVVLVQPNVDPYLEKYSSGNESTVNTIKELAAPALDENTDFLIAPETVLAEPVYLNIVPVDNATLALKQFLTTYPNLNYLGGAVIIDVFNDASQIKPQTNRTQDPSIFYDDYNSAMFFNATNNVELYHKSKLVVGVENFPYKSLLQPILGDAMIDLGGTVSTKTTQTERSVFTNDKGVSLAPIICYESVYGSYVSDYVTNGAQFLAIITNDAWWNDTQGHKQHLSIARLRAIENRKWIARSANTGISAIINPTGEIVESLGYDKKGILKGNVYPNDTVTFYAKQGDYLARIAIFMGIAVLLVGLFRNNGLTRKKS